MVFLVFMDTFWRIGGDKFLIKVQENHYKTFANTHFTITEYSINDNTKQLQKFIFMEEYDNVFGSWVGVWIWENQIWNKIGVAAKGPGFVCDKKGNKSPKDKITKNDLQNTTQKTKDRDTNLTIIRENSGAPEGTHIVLI
jgi:hypothetical protein